MIIRLLLCFIMIITSLSGTVAQEKIDYLVDDNLLSVVLNDLNANCCSEFIADYHINFSSGNITITISDTTLQKCRCNCNFDFSVNIGPIPQGKYTITVFREDNSKYSSTKDKRIQLGKKDVFVYAPHPKSPLVMDFRQSPCKNTSQSPIADEVVKNGIEIFPNPASGAISLKFNLKENSDVSVKILNFLGKELKEMKFKNMKSGTNLLHLDITDIPPGMYLGKVYSSNGQLINFKLMWSK